MKISPLALAIAAGVGLLAFAGMSNAAPVTATGGARNVTGSPQTLPNGTAGGVAQPSGGNALAALWEGVQGLFSGGGAQVTPASVVPGDGFVVNQAQTNTPALDVAAIIGASSVVGSAPAFQAQAAPDFVNTPTVPVAATVPASSGTAAAATEAPPFWFEPPVPVVTAQAAVGPVAVVAATPVPDRIDEDGVLTRWDEEGGRYKRVSDGQDG